MEKHPNSHIVYVKRKSFFDTTERPELDEYFASSSVSVGSYFAKGTSRPGSGLSIYEENLLLPMVIGYPVEDRDFRLKVNEYYSNINSKVPPNTNPPLPTDGLKLEIGLSENNNKPLSKDNLPIRIDDYVRYRQIILHPQVGDVDIEETEEDSLGNQMRKFVIHDPAKAQTTALTSNEARDQALMKYISIKSDPRKVRMYLTLLGVSLTTLRPGEELTKLREKAEKEPASFLKVASDPNLEIKYMIEELVHYKVLTKVGERLLNGQTEIGRNVAEAVQYLKDSHNTAVFASLKAALQNEWAKNSISVELEEDLTLKDSNKESDEQLEARMKAQSAKAAAAIDRSKGNKPKEEVLPEPEGPAGLQINLDPEPDYTPGENSLSSIEAGTSADSIAEEGETPVAVEDGRTPELHPDNIK